MSLIKALTATWQISTFMHLFIRPWLRLFKSTQRHFLLFELDYLKWHKIITLISVPSYSSFICIPPFMTVIRRCRWPLFDGNFLNIYRDVPPIQIYLVSNATCCISNGLTATSSADPFLQVNTAIINKEKKKLQTQSKPFSENKSTK